jgi:two-component system copper resistance phosphate regulon response regulator CusR
LRQNRKGAEPVKILIVEDEPKTGEYLRQGLSEAGYVADLVPHGTDGLHMALHGAYDLVILDVMLPGLNGWQVLQRCASAACKCQCCS